VDATSAQPAQVNPQIYGLADPAISDSSENVLTDAEGIRANSALMPATGRIVAGSAKSSHDICDRKARLYCDMGTDDFRSRIFALGQRFHARFPGQMTEIETTLATATANPAAVVSLRMALHAMAGNAPTLGFPQIGAEARRLEAVIAPAAETNRSLTDDEKRQVEDGLETLRALRDEQNETYS
jgi:HPt (histidine-containing phosphotransfer) domain-containing protein